MQLLGSRLGKMALMVMYPALALTISVRGNTFFVTDALDTTNITSLRGAIIAANVSGGNNIIVLTNNIYQLNISGSDENGAVTGDLDITNGSLAIIGSSWPQVAIDATGLGDRVFEVFSNAQLTMSDLLITGGGAPGDKYGYMEDGEPGGAIYNLGTLILENCIISNNASGGGNDLMGNAGGTSGGEGGGICNAGILTMANCSVMANSSGGGAASAFGGDGGGIWNSGECILTSCTISGNDTGAGGAPGDAIGSGGAAGNGGGIFNSGTLMLINCTVSSNATGSGGAGGQAEYASSFGTPGGPGGNGGNGGGLYNTGELWLSYSTVSSNSCGNGGGGGQGIGLYGSGGNPGPGGSGAGIYNTGALSLNTCTIGGNNCGGGGEGGFGFSSGGAVGASGGGGGGVYNGGSLSLIACTIAMNSTGFGGNGGSADDSFEAAPAASGGQGGSGGGIWNNGSNTTAVICNTLIALNATSAGGAGGTNTSGAIGDTGLNGSGIDGDGQFLSQGFNLIGQIGGLAGISNAINSDLAGNNANAINPHLSPLQMNGGSTPTFALLPGSLAIDAGDDGLLGPPENLAVDQRGSPRKSGAHVDIGAFEYDGMLNGIVLSPLLTDAVMTSGGLQFWFNGASGLNYSIWGSADLLTWINLGFASEVSEGWFVYQDFNTINHSDRFYQIRYP
jgi:hypothetical protein